MNLTHYHQLINNQEYYFWLKHLLKINHRKKLYSLLKFFHTHNDIVLFILYFTKVVLAFKIIPIVPIILEIYCYFILILPPFIITLFHQFINHLIFLIFPFQILISILPFTKVLKVIPLFMFLIILSL